MRPLPDHLVIAIREIGVLETVGPGDTPQIRAYHAATRAGPSPDSIAWCSSFGNWCYLQAGIIGTRSRAARSWLNPPPGFAIVTEPELGDGMVIDRYDPDNASAAHFSFYFGRGKRGIYGLGGNQQNEVNVQRYARKDVIAFLRYMIIDAASVRYENALTGPRMPGRDIADCELTGLDREDKT